MRSLFAWSLLAVALAACSPDDAFDPICDVYPDADGDGDGNATSPPICVPGTAAYYADGSLPPGVSATATDCDDRNPTVSGLSVFYVDRDGDGWGDSDRDRAAEGCVAPEGFVTLDGDCDDEASTVHPSAPEICDDASVDEDCDGRVNGDDDDPLGGFDVWRDLDRDGYGDPNRRFARCGIDELQPGDVLNDDDCDDTDPTVSPDTVWSLDRDGDGFGDTTGGQVRACVPPAAYVLDTTDCDDADPAVNPAATEVCNAGVDDDCDGVADDDDDSLDPASRPSWYRDYDRDGFGTRDRVEQVCDPGRDYALAAGDCDDNNAARNPGVEEICDPDDVDENCDGTADDDDPGVDPTTFATYYTDADGDGYGDPDVPVASCDPLEDTVDDDHDCDDFDDTIHPGATEVCNEGVDDDCDGAADDDDPSLDATTGETFYVDVDGDGYGDPGLTWRACEAPTGFVDDDTDCDDDDDTVFPGATEACNGVDDDCDEVVDDGVMGNGSSCPADDCDAIDQDRSTASGTYWIDFGGDGDVEQVACDMDLSDGGWTQLTSAVVDEMTSDAKRFLYTKNGAWYLTPSTTATWSYTAGVAVTGTYTYRAATSASGSSFLCPTNRETPLYGIGCSTGAGTNFKVAPYQGGGYPVDQTGGEISLCQDRPGLFSSTCASGVQAWVRYE